MNFQNNTYQKLLIGISSITLAFHLLILLKIIPYAITWGGKLKSDQEMYVFEMLSIAINLFFLYILLQSGNYVKALFGRKTLSVILWIFFAIFMLNTIGNLFAKTTFEKSFAIVTLANAVLIWLVNKKSNPLDFAIKNSNPKK